MGPMLIKLYDAPDSELQEACERAQRIVDIQAMENPTEEDEMYLDWCWDRLRRLSFHITKEDYDTHVRAILP